MATANAPRRWCLSPGSVQGRPAWVTMEMMMDCPSLTLIFIQLQSDIQKQGMQRGHTVTAAKKTGAVRSCSVSHTLYYLSSVL